MKGDKFKILLIMINLEFIYQFGNNVYGKLVIVFNILWEIIMGCEFFDYVFKVYVNCWMFKYFFFVDFFWIMEDVFVVDFDWFWWGWFFMIDYVDIVLDDVKYYCMDIKDLLVESKIFKEQCSEFLQYISSF